jgi:hypothetical protein
MANPPPGGLMAIVGNFAGNGRNEINRAISPQKLQ